MAGDQLSYLTAFGFSFVLNRALNFRSHAPVGRQTVLYVAAITINFGAILLGIGGGLTALGVPDQASRIIGAACEGVFMYCTLRWVVFAQRPTSDRNPPEPRRRRAVHSPRLRQPADRPTAPRRQLGPVRPGRLSI